jgi:molybdopterin-binding protein
MAPEPEIEIESESELESKKGADGMATGHAGLRDRRNAVAVETWTLFQIDERDPAPAYIQLERRVRVAVADGVLKPGDALPSVRKLAGQIGVSPNTVGRAYADLAREGVIVARAGGGSAIAAHERLDHPTLQRSRQERLLILSRQPAVRGLALGFDASQIVEALKRELASHGHPVPPTIPPTPLGEDEVPLLSSRNRLRGTVASVRAGEMLAEVTLEVPAARVVAAITRVSLDRLGLEPGRKASAYVKASEVTLGP